LEFSLVYLNLNFLSFSLPSQGVTIRGIQQQSGASIKVQDHKGNHKAIKPSSIPLLILLLCQSEGAGKKAKKCTVDVTGRDEAVAAAVQMIKDVLGGGQER
jgi:hypothetical protein